MYDRSRLLVSVASDSRKLGNTFCVWLLPTREPISYSQLVTNEISALAYVGPVTESRIFGYKTNAVRSPSDIMVRYFVGTVTYDLCWIS